MASVVIWKCFVETDGSLRADSASLAEYLQILQHVSQF